MKIALIADPIYPVPPPKYGGVERVIYYLIKGLQEIGHEPILFGAANSSVSCEIIPIVKKSIGYPKIKAGLPAHLLRVKTINKATRLKIRKFSRQVDIIHSHGFDLRGFERFPNLTTIHNPITFSDIKYYQSRKNLYFVAISKNQREVMPDIKYAGVVYNGEDPTEYPVVLKPEDYVCFVGRFDEQKSPHLAIKLALDLDVRIKLAGKLDYHGTRYFNEEIKPLLSHKSVEYLGELDTGPRTELLAHAKCNLHPTSFREPFGLTVLEAAYCGTPTLAIERGSMPELIREGKTGMLVEDFVEGYSQIEECFKMDRAYIARRARKQFNYIKMAESYVKAYKKVVRQF